MAARKKQQPYVIARAARAGVFAGTLVSRSGQQVMLRDARRIWYWAGAATLSQLALDGTKEPAGCKFPAPVPEVTLFEVVEIIPASPRAQASIEGVPVWAR